MELQALSEHHAKREVTIEDVVTLLQVYHPSAEVNLVRRAFVFAENHHREQYRKNGDPYIGHPVAVAHILCGMRLDTASVCAALLHDVVEDTEATLDDLRSVFSNEIAELVDGVTKLSKIRFRSKQELQAENFRKMLIAMSKDIRVILVKLADRTHNMRTLQHLPKPEKRRGIARETMDIYAPIANRLGLGAVKTELEDLSFRHLHEQEYQSLRHKVDKKLSERQDYIRRVIGSLREIMEDDGLDAVVTGRPKHFYSIHKKMIAQHIPFEKVYDVVAFRVTVARQSQCYHALGLIHERWRPVPGRFKDYIALPKPNGYKSLHTSVFGPDGQQLEVQIRTEAMHRIAESGIAAHWKYKESGRRLGTKDEEHFEWLKRLMEWQQELDDPDEFLESVKVELFDSEVFTFTPRGELKVLPRGSTPVDFAYAVHSEVGNTCSGALINGSITPLSTPLRNGDTVDIVTNRSQRPNKDWLKFVKTNRARNRIKAHLRKEQRARSLELGEQLLEKELRRYSRSLARMRRSSEFKALAEQLGQGSVEDVIARVGSGMSTPESIVFSLLPDLRNEQAKPVLPPSQNVISRFLRRVRGGPSGVIVDGLEGVQHTIARCCSPVPGEAIVGFVTLAHVVSVHRHGCDNVVDLAPERRVEVRWGGSVKAGYPACVRVITETKVPGLLNKMTKVFSDLSLNIDMANCAEAEDGRASNVFRFHTENVDDINAVVRGLEQLKGVYAVERIRQTQ